MTSELQPGASSGRRRRRGSRRKWLSWMQHLLSSNSDVMALLVTQGEVSVKALEAFEAWSKGGREDCARRVHELEHDADDARHELVAALRSSFATPVGQEDLFVLSERCDRVVNRVKNIVAEAEALTWTPEAHAARMAEELRTGMSSILAGFKALTSRGDETSAAAVTATHCVRGVEHTYRDAMVDLAVQTDLREVFTSREMYRFYVRAAEALETLADRLWYAVLAEP
jgi:uncharacterized protein Yka (UPF0111/DUF47 family)